MTTLTLVKSRKDEMPAGRELDLEIAGALRVAPSENVPPYSTDDDTAIALAESFSKRFGFWEHVKLEVDGAWTVAWIEGKQPLHHSMKPIQSTGETLALAICRSILKVVASVKDRRGPGNHFPTR